MTHQPSLDSASRRVPRAHPLRSLLCSAAPQSRARSRLGSSLVCLSIPDLSRSPLRGAACTVSSAQHASPHRTRDLGRITRARTPSARAFCARALDPKSRLRQAWQADAVIARPSPGAGPPPSVPGPGRAVHRCVCTPTWVPARAARAGSAPAVTCRPRRYSSCCPALIDSLSAGCTLIDVCLCTAAPAPPALALVPLRLCALCRALGFLYLCRALHPAR